MTICKHQSGEFILLHNLKSIYFCWRTRTWRLHTLFKFLIHVPLAARLEHPNPAAHSQPAAISTWVLALGLVSQLYSLFPSSSSNLGRTGPWTILSSFMQPFRHLPHNKFKIQIYKFMSFSSSNLRKEDVSYPENPFKAAHLHIIEMIIETIWSHWHME